MLADGVADGTLDGVFDVNDNETVNISDLGQWRAVAETQNGFSQKLVAVWPGRSWKALGLSRPEGIASNGEDLWIADRGNDRVHFFDGGATRTTNTGATSSFALVVGNPRGITTDGTHLWIADTGTDDVYKYTVGGTFLGNWALDSQNTLPRGITIDRET